MPSQTFAPQFINADQQLDNWDAIEPYFDELAGRNLQTPAEVEQWLVDSSELLACIEELGTDRHVKMTCKTDDEARKAAFFDFIENIEPKCKPRCHELNVKYVECLAAKDLPMPRYQVLDRAIRREVELFRDENVALQTQEAKLSQRFQEICGAQTVQFDGKEQTLQQLALYSERTDRDLRESAWKIEADRRLEDAEVLEDIFDELIQLRTKIAHNAGCSDYREYAFMAKHRFDYTPQDCLDFHDAIEKTAVGVSRDLQRQRAKTLGVDPLRPWDRAVDVHGREPLRPFETVEQLCAKASKVFHRVDPDLGGQFDEMRKAGYLDLDSRKGKAPGGYQATYEASRHPFIFMNAVGIGRDVRTMIHEGGHAFHTYAARHDSLVSYRSSPIEFAEVASFGMEMLSLEYLDEFYDGEGLARATREQLEGIISLFPWVATIDAFQHFLYTNPNHSREERKQHWLELHKRFGGIADYTGHEEVLNHSWQRQLHLFEVPFYYIEYAIAKIGALQVWRNAQQDRPAATTAYRAALALGGSRPLPELFTAANTEFDFTQRTLAPLIDLVREKLAALPD